MAKSKEKILSRELRNNGLSIKEIARKLRVSVGSVSSWCNDIVLTKKQQEVLNSRIKDPFYGNKYKYLAERKASFIKKVENLKQEGISEIGKMSKREVLLVGIALYWGEGFKKDHLVGLATSDTKMAMFYVHWLDCCFGIKNTQLILRVTANISYKKNIGLLEKYWAKQLNIPQVQFSKPYFQKTKWKKIYENKNEYHGVIRIKVRKSVTLLRKIFGYIEGVSMQFS